MLEKIKSPEDLKTLHSLEIKALAREIREFMIEKVQRTGGHLASNLGVVELMIALHSVFDFKKDRIIFDVSHQSYVHKILSGRRDEFNHLREFGGISGFTDPLESVYDVFKVGHAGTSISTALGMKTAKEVLGRNEKVIAFIGDASISNGVAFEAINHIGHLKKNLIIILNDNQMSISQTVGGFAKHLSRFISGKFYNTIKQDLESFLHDIPVIGDSVNQTIKNLKKTIKKQITPNIFEEFGINYIGPIDGYDVEQMIKIFSNSDYLSDEPVIFHVLTKKGKGLKEAEENPTFYHGLSSSLKKKEDSFTAVFGEKMTEIAKKDPKIAVITAAMTDGTGLNQFSEELPAQYYDVGIAEEHAVAFAAGLAKEGLKPFIAIYSTFLQRAVDQIFQEVSLQEDINPVFVMDRSGLCGEDGPTHHGAFDIAYTRFFPRAVLISPKDGRELENMMEWAKDQNNPVFIRFPKGGFYSFPESKAIEYGKSEIILEEKEAEFTVFSYGSLTGEAYLMKDFLSKKFNLVNLRFAKPLDMETILYFAQKKLPIIVVEEHSLAGGVGEAVASLLMEKGFNNPFLRLGLEDYYYPHGERSLLLQTAGLDSKNLSVKIARWLA
ncbi:MAG: 1-deoxy-D-xylulose-5-phosphate synthase [Spirochaetes bacterium GWB1_36_13]|nr:MAG: 1-deoxy-D-xylulose-5-phosphate synthase [Spirochaetes bacterium GWB1_36_13]